MKGTGWVREVRGLLGSQGATAAGERSRLTVNERLIREQDRERTRELGRLSLLGVAVLLPLLLYVWLQVSFVETAYRVEGLQTEKAELDRLLRKTEMERASLETPERIERMARGGGMQQPSPESVVAVELRESGSSGGGGTP